MNNSNFVNENTFSLFVMLSIFGISLILGSVEAFVISRFCWAKFSKSLVYAFISNYISAAITALLSLILLVLVFVFLVQGAISCVFGCNDPRVVDDSAIPMANYVGLYLVTIPTLFFLSKRFFIFAFQIRNGWIAWVYALISSLLTLATIIGVPILFLKYFLK